MRFGAGVFLLGVFLFAAVSSAGSGSLGIRAFVERVNQAVPRVTRQITKAVGGSKLATICAATVCVLHFSLPAPAADLNGLRMHSELLKGQGHHSIFARRGSEEQGFRGTWRIGKGFMLDHDTSVGTLKLGFEGELPTFSFYINSAFSYDPSNTSKIDDIGIETETYAGADFLWLSNKLKDMEEALGYHGIDVFVGDRLVVRSLRSYLFYYEGKGFLRQAAFLGHEYFDGDVEDVQDSDELRGHLLSFYRLKLAHDFITANGNKVSLGLSSVFAGGGELWQEELLDWLDRNRLSSAFHKGGVSLDITLADGRATLGFGGSYITAFQDGGSYNFFVGEGVASASLGIVIIPEYGIDLESYIELRQQRIEAEKIEDDSRELSRTSNGHRVAVFLVKRFE